VSTLILAALALAAAADRDSTATKLERVREQITGIQKALRAETNRRDAVAARLREAETTVARVQGELDELRARRAAGQLQLEELHKERRAVERTLGTEREALGRQLRAAHMIAATGRNEQLKLLFNQQDPARLGRMFTYYGYFGRSRADHIRTIGAQLEQLRTLEEELAATGAALQRLQAQARAELDALKQARSQRAGVVSDLEKQIHGRQTQLARLKREEDTLEKLLAQLRRVTADFPVTREEPFEKARGKLSWPVSGRVVADFGATRAAGIKWNGVLLAAERGSQVRAVYFGRVIYADWLPGMGLLTILEHSGGYWSLYGYNEQLYKAFGDWVEPGDVIASAGDSGGRERPELYFEIRKGARPVDPRQWIRK
jgi:septal ring factor EnvC (AmiA/AmiB activator)